MARASLETTTQILMTLKLRASHLAPRLGYSSEVAGFSAASVQSMLAASFGCT